MAEGRKKSLTDVMIHGKFSTVFGSDTSSDVKNANTFFCQRAGGYIFQMFKPQLTLRRDKPVPLMGPTLYIESLTLPMQRLLSRFLKDLKTVMMVFIGKLSLSTLR